MYCIMAEETGCKQSNYICALEQKPDVVNLLKCCIYFTAMF